MSTTFRGARVAWTLVFCGSMMLSAQTRTSRSPAHPDLTAEYDAAHRAQQANHLTEAADHYRRFLAQALRELGFGHAQAEDDVQATTLFSEASLLEPETAVRQLQEAEIALRANLPAEAESMAQSVLTIVDISVPQRAHAHQLLGRALLNMNHNREARAELEKAVDLDPTFENGYDLAVACLDLDDEKCAAHLFAEISRAFGDTSELHMHMGNAYANSDFQQKAIDEYEHVLRLDPHAHGVHYALAATLLAISDDTEHTTRAESELRKELMVSPRDALTLAALGKILASQQHNEEAEKLLRESIKIAPERPDAYLYLGQLLSETNRTQEAIDSLRASISKTEDESYNRYQVQKAHYLLGRLLMQTHKPAEAKAEMQAAHDLLDKGLAKDRRKLAGLLDHPELNEAGANSDDAKSAAHRNSSSLQVIVSEQQRLAPILAESYNNLGILAASNARYSEALHDFEQSAHWNSAQDGIDYNLGRAAFSAAAYDKAVAPLRRCLKSDPHDDGVRTALAMSAYMTGSYGETLTILSDADAAVQSIPQMQYIAAMAELRSGSVAKARMELESFARIHPEIGEAHSGWAEALAASGDARHAIEQYRVAIRMHVDDAATWAALAALELANGQVTAAVSDFATASGRAPNNAQYHRQLAEAYAQADRPVEAKQEAERARVLLSAQQGTH